MKWFGPVNNSMVRMTTLTWTIEKSMSSYLPSHHKLLTTTCKIIPQIVKTKLLRMSNVNLVANKKREKSNYNITINNLHIDCLIHFKVDHTSMKDLQTWFWFLGSYQVSQLNKARPICKLGTCKFLE